MAAPMYGPHTFSTPDVHEQCTVHAPQLAGLRTSTLSNIVEMLGSSHRCNGNVKGTSNDPAGLSRSSHSLQGYVVAPSVALVSQWERMGTLASMDHDDNGSGRQWISITMDHGDNGSR
eukprot:scaffold246822_cov19-Tisochrysis_lutea.AAC.1